MSHRCPLNVCSLKYTHMIGTGGIGSGIFFKLEGSHTLGRNESRLGELVPYRDYCKLHIISHYASILLGSGMDKAFRTYAIGKVGEDTTGKQMIAEMQEAGVNTVGVGADTDASTLFSVCFQYPDSTGGNITTSNSASGLVTCEDIDAFFNRYEGWTQGGLFLAAPEVPVDARKRLLEYGRSRGSFNVASLLSSEVEEFRQKGVFESVDLLAVNIDEAGAIAGISDENADARTIVDNCIKTLATCSQGISVVITDGPEGSYGFNGKDIEYVPALKTEAVGTGGAGDALLSGIITGLCCGLPLLKGRSDAVFSGTPLYSAIELGTLLASLSVMSPDTIHRDVDAQLLLSYAKQKSVSFSPEFAKLFDFNEPQTLL